MINDVNILKVKNKNTLITALNTVITLRYEKNQFAALLVVKYFTNVRVSV